MRFPSRIRLFQGSPNKLTALLDDKRRAGGSILDLTLSNPTRAGIVYPDDLLAPLADPASRLYEPAPRGLPAARAAVAADHLRRGLAVDPEARRAHFGRRLVERVVESVRAEGGRVVRVETSSKYGGAVTRAFYTKVGFTEAGRIGGFYGEGDDLVLYALSL